MTRENRLELIKRIGERICPPCYYCGNEPNPTTKVLKHDQSCPYRIFKDLSEKIK